jgi:hypothetical protein
LKQRTGGVAFAFVMGCGATGAFEFGGASAQNQPMVQDTGENERGSDHDWRRSNYRRDYGVQVER